MAKLKDTMKISFTKDLSYQVPLGQVQLAVELKFVKQNRYTVSFLAKKNKKETILIGKYDYTNRESAIKFLISAIEDFEG